MKVTIEPQSDVVYVTIEDDRDAQEFWRVAAEVVAGDQPVCDALREQYSKYGRRHAEEDRIPLSRQLWDAQVRSTRTDGGIRISTTFSVGLLSRLGVIS